MKTESNFLSLALALFLCLFHGKENADTASAFDLYKQEEKQALLIKHVYLRSYQICRLSYLTKIFVLKVYYKNKTINGKYYVFDIGKRQIKGRQIVIR